MILCGALAFITYGLNRALCPPSSQASNTPYSQVVDGQRIPVYHENPRVFGQIYPMDALKSFFATKGLNLTNDYQNVELSGIFDGDTGGYCRGFPNTLPACQLIDPYGGGMLPPNNTCLSLAELQAFYHSRYGVLGFDWEDLNKHSITGQSLALLGDSGNQRTKKKRNKKFLNPF